MVAGYVTGLCVPVRRGRYWAAAPRSGPRPLFARMNARTSDAEGMSTRASADAARDDSFDHTRYVHSIREDYDANVQFPDFEVVESTNIEQIASEFLRMKFDASSKEELENYLLRVKFETLRFLADDLIFLVKFDLAEAAAQDDVNEILCQLRNFGEKLLHTNEDMPTVKWEMRKLLWDLRERLERLNPPEHIRCALEETRAGLLDMTFEDKPEGLDAESADLIQRRSMLKFVLEETVLMFELRSLRVLVREAEFAAQMLSQDMFSAWSGPPQALRKVSECCKRMSIGEGIVQGKDELLCAVVELHEAICSYGNCPLAVQRPLETLRTALHEAVKGDSTHGRKLRGTSMPMRPRIQDIPNFERVTDFLLRGGQPNQRGIQWLMDYSVRAVVDLRGSDRQNQWVPIASWGPIKLFNIAIEDFEAPSVEQVCDFVEIANDPENRPLFVHCKAGVGRTGTIVACWRVSNGESVAEALRKERLYSKDGGGLRQEDFVWRFAREWRRKGMLHQRRLDHTRRERKTD